MKGTEWSGKKENKLCVLDVAGNTYSRGWGGGGGGGGRLPLPLICHCSCRGGRTYSPAGISIHKMKRGKKERAQNLPSAL
jgi:hypothetical protein